MTKGEQETHHAEQRRHTRIAIRATALLFDRGRNRDEWGALALGRFAVGNVSLGGALIHGKIPVPIGAPVGIHLHLPETNVQMGSVVVRRDHSPDGDSLALRFETVPARDQEVIRRIIEGHLFASGGPTWHTLQALASAHAQQCARCRHPVAARHGQIPERCRSGRDLQLLVRAVSRVLTDQPTHHQRDLIRCRALTLDWLGRDLDSETVEVLRRGLDEPAARALSGRGPEIRPGQVRRQ
jgi:hypothetical protein